MVGNKQLKRNEASESPLRSALLLLASATAVQLTAATLLAAQPELYPSDAFVVTDTSVRQGPFEAVAVSRERIVTTYPRAAREVMFKFSINGADNEFPPGQDHMIYVRPRDGEIVTPVYTFGQLDPPLIPEPSPALTSEEGTARVTFQLDMRHVLESFRTRGSYEPPNGPPVDAGDFEAVYVVGNEEPLSWDFGALRPGSPFELRDPDGDGVHTVTLPFEATYNRPVDDEGRAYWSLGADLSRFPEYTSSQPLVDALYRLSLEELLELIRDDGALLGGARWPAVWTRDVSWGAILALAPIAPDEVRHSLLLKVDEEGRIIQDTGTGGSWPVSTDRMAWAVAAWELYAATGDREWLGTAFEIIRRSTEADLATAFDPATGLFHGESSFLDWREQSYPRWMDPKDIYVSQALGTNALHFATYRILARMARELGEPAERFEEVAEAVRDGMNGHLWQADRGYYGQFLYGRNHLVLSPRAEGLGEAFAILFGVAESAQRKRLAGAMPVVPFGVPSFWPYIPDIPPYHNAGIWPQVSAFWTWASAEAGNTAGVEHGLAAMVRAAALFLTNKENMVAATGHFEGTELNSDRLIGSVGGMLAMVYRVLLGMRFHPDRLSFEPFIPKGYLGERTLRGLRYRDAWLTVTVRGFGNLVTRASLDGRSLARAEVPADLTGAHTLEITMNGGVPASRMNLVENLDAPETPVATLEEAGQGVAIPERGDGLVWGRIAGAVRYVVYRNGEPVATTADTVSPVERSETLTEYQVLAQDARGLASFLSEPVRVAPAGAVQVVQPPAGALESRLDGFTGRGYLPLSPDTNTVVTIPLEVAAPGLYAIDVRYANGSGPINSGDRAAVRTLLVDGERVGALVLPQRGTDLWTDWGYSNALHVRLERGTHVLTVSYTATDRNMSVEVNDALLDHVRVTLLDTGTVGHPDSQVTDPTADSRLQLLSAHRSSIVPVLDIKSMNRDRREWRDRAHQRLPYAAQFVGR